MSKKVDKVNIATIALLIIGMIKILTILEFEIGSNFLQFIFTSENVYIFSLIIAAGLFFESLQILKGNKNANFIMNIILVIGAIWGMFLFIGSGLEKSIFEIVILAFYLVILFLKTAHKKKIIIFGNIPLFIFIIITRISDLYYLDYKNIVIIYWILVYFICIGVEIILLEEICRKNLFIICFAFYLVLIPIFHLINGVIWGFTLLSVITIVIYLYMLIALLRNMFIQKKRRKNAFHE